MVDPLVTVPSANPGSLGGQTSGDLLHNNGGRSGRADPAGKVRVHRETEVPHLKVSAK